METGKSIRDEMIQTTFIENIIESLCLSIGKKDIWLTKLKYNCLKKDRDEKITYTLSLTNC